jgi:segregation and condensation protein B
LQVDESQVETALQLLAEQYLARGLRLQRQNDLVQLVTAPQAAADVERFLGLDSSSRLSTAALEALALIAYRQPITRVQVEAIRGVNCDGVLRTLLARGLVTPQGRLEQAGRPIVYGTTFEFLQSFGLSSLSELPALEDLHAWLGGGESSAHGRETGETTPAHAI